MKAMLATLIGAAALLGVAAPASAHENGPRYRHGQQHDRLADRHDRTHDRLEYRHDRAHDYRLTRREHRAVHRDLNRQHRRADRRLERRHNDQHDRRDYGRYY